MQKKYYNYSTNLLFIIIMLQQKLQEYGLSEKQALIYLKTLELWASPASTIAKHSKINRVSTYDILKSLHAMGIVSSMKKKNTTYYSVISPQSLASRLQQKLDSFHKAVPELMAIAEKFANKPKVQFFEWIEGIKEIYESLLNSQTDILAFVGPGVANKKLMTYLREDFLPRRVKAKIFAKVISPQSNKDAEWYASLDKKYYKETRLIQNPLFTMTNEIWLFDNDKIYLSLFNNQELSWLIIHSKSLYHTLEQIFTLVRTSLEPQ